MGIEIRTNNSKAIFDLPGHWQKFKKISDTIPGGQVMVVYSEYENDHNGDYNYLIGKEVEGDITCPEGMEIIEIEDDPYEKKEVKGMMPFALIGAWKEIWASGLNRAYHTDYEIHKGSDEVEIHVGVKE